MSQKLRQQNQVTQPELLEKISAEKTVEPQLVRRSTEDRRSSSHKKATRIGSPTRPRQESNTKPRQESNRSELTQKSIAATQGKKSKTGSPLDQFKVMNNLGDGAYSKVYKVQRKADGQTYALKMVALKNLSDKEKENAINEVRILASIKHPNIICYKEAFIDKPSESLCIVMELVDMGDLYGQIMKSLKKQGSSIPQADLEYEGLKEEFIWRVFIQVVKGLKSMHDLNIMHRDLKSANVFLNSDDSVKLGDMNVSKVASKEGLNFTQTGTPYYASPEVWRDEPYDIKSDIWSLGCVLYEMITLKPPFQASSMKGLFKRVCTGKIMRIPKSYSVDLWTIVKQMLNVNPKLRPDCTKLLENPILLAKEKQYLKKPQMAYQNYSQTHSELLKTIIFPKGNLQNIKKLPEPRYNGNDAMSEQAPPSSEKQRLSKNLSSQKTYDSSVGPINSSKQKAPESGTKMKQPNQANPVVSKDLKKMFSLNEKKDVQKVASINERRKTTEQSPRQKEQDIPRQSLNSQESNGVNLPKISSKAQLAAKQVTKRPSAMDHPDNGPQDSQRKGSPQRKSSPYLRNQQRRNYSPYARGQPQQLNVVGVNSSSPSNKKQNNRYKHQPQNASVDLGYTGNYDQKKSILKSNRELPGRHSQQQVHISNYDILMRKNNEYQQKQRLAYANYSPKKRESYDAYIGVKNNKYMVNKSINYSLDNSFQEDPPFIQNKRSLGGASSQMLQNQGLYHIYDSGLQNHPQYIKRSYVNNNYNYNSQSIDTLPKNEQYLESIDVYKSQAHRSNKKIAQYQQDMKNTIENHRRQRMKENISQITEVYSSQKKNKYVKNPLIINGINNQSYNRLNNKSQVNLPELSGQPYVNSRSNSNAKSMKYIKQSPVVAPIRNRNTRNLNLSYVGSKEDPQKKTEEPKSNLGSPQKSPKKLNYSPQKF